MSIWSLAPAAVTIAVAVGTRKIFWALLAGVGAGALALHGLQNPLLVLNQWGGDVLHPLTDLERVQIACFVILIGGMLRLIGHSGAYTRFARTLSEHLNTPRKARLTTWALGFSLFFDDYANVLITGATMGGVLRRHRVSRLLTAYLLNMLAILSSVMLISTWAAYEAGLIGDAARESGLAIKGIPLFLSAIPYHYYTFFSLFLTLLTACTGRWWGGRDRLPPPDTTADEHHSRLEESPARLRQVWIPLMVLVGMALGGLFLTGWINLLRHPAIPRNLVNLIGQAPTVSVLLAASLSATLSSLFLTVRGGIFTFPKALGILGKGMRSMLEVGGVILLAASLARISEALQTGPFIALHLKGFATPLFVGGLVFLMATGISLATGFSWSTMAILFPVAFPLALSMGGTHALPAVIAAVISGSIAGDQMVPFSDKSVMTAAACQIPPTAHARTQLPHVLVAVLFTLGAGLATSMGLPLWATYLGGALLLLLLHHLTARKP